MRAASVENPGLNPLWSPPGPPWITIDIAGRCDLILLSLPDGEGVAAVIAELEPHLHSGQCVVDTSTSSVPLTRDIGARLAARGIAYADAPVARTREAAARGELSIMVG